MNRNPTLRRPLRRGAAVALTVTFLLAACKDRAPDVPVATSSTTMPVVPTTTSAAPASTVPEASAHASAPPQASTPVGGTVALPQKIPLSIQGVSAAGVTVRVKAVEIGVDATVLDVSISFANRITDTTMLALADTYLQDESGARLHIKRPDNNRDITIREGETLDGQLVFMGAVAPTARRLKLVFNDGNEGDNIVAPGLTVDIPLQGS